MTRDEIRAAVTRAEAHIATWPEWKRNATANILANSPTVKVPRTPVDNGVRVVQPEREKPTDDVCHPDSPAAAQSDEAGRPASPDPCG